MMCVQFVFVRDDFLQAVFDLAGVFSGREIGAVADAKNMGVDSDGRLSKNHIQHHIGSLASHAGKGFERVAIPRHLATMICYQGLR